MADLPENMRFKIKPNWLFVDCYDVSLQKKGLFGWNTVDRRLVEGEKEIRLAKARAVSAYNKRVKWDKKFEEPTRIETSY